MLLTSSCGIILSYDLSKTRWLYIAGVTRNLFKNLYLCLTCCVLTTVQLVHFVLCFVVIAVVLPLRALCGLWPLAWPAVLWRWCTWRRRVTTWTALVWSSERVLDRLMSWSWLVHWPIRWLQLCGRWGTSKTGRDGSEGSVDILRFRTLSPSYLVLVFSGIKVWISEGKWLNCLYILSVHLCVGELYGSLHAGWIIVSLSVDLQFGMKFSPEE